MSRFSSFLLSKVFFVFFFLCFSYSDSPILRHPDSLLSLFHVFKFHNVLAEPKSSKKK